MEKSKEEAMPEIDTENRTQEDWHKHLEFIQNVVTRLQSTDSSRDGGCGDGSGCTLGVAGG
jgi:hypothetical protein